MQLRREAGEEVACRQRRAGIDEWGDSGQHRIHGYLCGLKPIPN